jgi:hypothetical protein
LLVLTLLAALVVPATADAGRKAIWGPIRMPDGTSAFPVYDQLGVDVYQMTMLWNRVAPARPADPRDPNDPAYKWSRDFETAVQEARAHRMRVLLLVKGTPPWANGGKGVNYPPRALGDFADFLTAAARRYRGVKLWMIWGETNFEGGANFFPMPDGSPTGPRRYARLLDRAYGALKRVRRSNIVIGGNTYSAGAVKPRDFVRFMKLPGGKRPRLDWYGHNPYTARFPKLSNRAGPDGYRDISDADTLAREVDRAFPGRPKLWLSEFTVSSDRPNRAFNFFVSREEQARWVRSAFRIARKPYVAGLGWFNLHDEPATQSNGLTTGLMTYEGERKPAFDAYRRAR